MARRKRPLLVPRHVRLEIVPMIDIMMFLLIFFVMITLSMIPNAGLTVELPGAATAATLPASPMVIALDKEARLHVGGEELTLGMLQDRLARPGHGGTTSVVIASDRSVTFQQVMAVMDAVRAAGISTIGLATKLN